ncbi:MAG: SIMPL domain-containing protein [Candidatus Micrarchaeota archaeon]
MADNSMLMIGIVVVVLITAGLTYYIAKSGETVSPPMNVTNDTGTQPTITVRGEATKTVMPDLVTLSLSIESFGNTTQEAQAQSAKDVAKLKTALLAAGVDESDIQTGSYYTYEVYNESCYQGCYYYADAVYEKMAISSEPAYGGVAYPDIYPAPPYPCERNCTIIGYKTIHTLSVESDKVNDSGKMIDAATGAVNTSVDYIYFSVKEETRLKLETELQAAAAASARAKAESIAQGLGSKVGKIISVSPDYYYPYYPSYAYDSAVSSDGSVPTEIFPRETTMSSSMTVVFELE